MADRRITEHTAITGSSVDAANDQIEIVDVSDTTDAATGTNKRITPTELLRALGVTASATELNLLDGITAIDTDGTLASNSDSKIPSQKAVKTYVDTAVTGLLDFKGATDCSATPNYPAASKGDAYVVSVAGKIGGASGKSVDVGDVYLATTDNAGGTEASVGTSWIVLEHNLVGALLSANNLSDLASTSTARTNLGVAIGSDVQAYSANLTDIATKWTPESGSGPASLKFHENTGNGTSHVALLGPDSIASNRLISLPDESGTVVTTNGGMTFTNDIQVPAEVYGAGWNGSNEVPTKNDIYDKIETLSGGGETFFNSNIQIFYWDYLQFGSDSSFGVGFGNNSSGSGAQTLYPASEEGRNGIVTIHSGTTTTGRGAWWHLHGYDLISIYDAALTMWVSVRPNTAASDGTDTYNIIHGLTQNVDSGDPVNGIFLFYDKDVNGGNWTVKMRRASTTELTLDTGVAFSNGTWATFRIEVAKADQAISVYNTSGSLLVTGTPSARIASGQVFGIVDVIKKSAGTNNRTFSSDYFYLKIDRS